MAVAYRVIFIMILIYDLIMIIVFVSDGRRDCECKQDVMDEDEDDLDLDPRQIGKDLPW